MKITLELIINENGTKFLNFWDFMHGDDVCSEIKDGEIYISDENSDEVDYINKISLKEFIEKVEKNTSNWIKK